jgi:hypothetical protein
VIARALAAIALIASVGFVSPMAEPAPAGGVAKTIVTNDPLVRLHDAVENATHRHVPGASGSDWVLHRVDRSEPGIDGREFIVATGVITTAGAPDTRMRLTGYYDAANGELARVSYKLQPAAPAAPAADTDTDWSVQLAVQHAFAQVLPDQAPSFALDSAQSSRVEGGGRRFEGSGIGTWGSGDARFVAFELTLSARGELVEFDYSTPGLGQDAAYVADH